MDERRHDRRRRDASAAYIEDTARTFGIDRAIRFDHRVERASWSSDTARWTVSGIAPTPARPFRLTCRFLFMCSGYYEYDHGYTPDFPGVERFAGRIVHPQAWTDDIDHAGKRVVVIGSGATAVTLVPSLAETGRARDDAPALADVHRVADRRSIRSRAGCARRLPARPSAT